MSSDGGGAEAGGGNDSPLAVDIITYVGVPLTVLGILPILYNTAVTLSALSRVKRLLRKSHMKALTRSDVVNRVIEIELPRYAVTPWDRFQHRGEYWSLSRSPSSIPGGTWTTFNWRTNTIGIKTQRIEYADQLRQPQVEVAFDELVCYLLDLGAVPDPQGWRILRSTGQWTPVGCALMRSPDGRNKALTIAPADESDGYLSLAVLWQPEWTSRDHSSLPPYWVRLSPPPPENISEGDDTETTVASSSMPKSQSTATLTATDKDEKDDVEGTGQANPFEEAAVHDLKKESNIKFEGEPTKKPSIDSVAKAVASNAMTPITCQVSTEGLVNALTEEIVPYQSTHFNSLYIEHLRLGRLPSYYEAGGPAGTRTGIVRQSSGGTPCIASKTAGMWFASAITAYGTGDQTVLWNYKIPDSILRFSRKETVPCGVLVDLEMVDIAETPEWATHHDDARADAERFFQRSREQQRAVQAESRMTPTQRSDAQRQRMARDAEERFQDMRARMRRTDERNEKRVLEAIQSPRWHTLHVADYALAYLKNRGKAVQEATRKDLVGNTLHRMILDGEFAGKVAAMLDLWKTWADNGGMRKGDFSELKKDAETFALALLLVALISETAEKLEGTLAMDLQECLALWKKVRLG